MVAIYNISSFTYHIILNADNLVVKFGFTLHSFNYCNN